MSISSSLTDFHESKSNFTIDHILNVAGEKPNVNNTSKFYSEASKETGKFEWLTCTRYKPPKLHRQRKKDGNSPRKKLGRNPRIPFTNSQIAFLEARFLENPYLNSADVSYLATLLRLTEARVKIWFQNRRAREKKGNFQASKIKKFKMRKSSISNILKFSPLNWSGLLSQEENFVPNSSQLLKHSKMDNAKYDYIKTAAPLDLSEKSSNADIFNTVQNQLACRRNF